MILTAGMCQFVVSVLRSEDLCFSTHSAGHSPIEYVASYTNGKGRRNRGILIGILHFKGRIYLIYWIAMVRRTQELLWRPALWWEDSWQSLGKHFKVTNCIYLYSTVVNIDSNMNCGRCTKRKLTNGRESIWLRWFSLAGSCAVNTSWVIKLSSLYIYPEVSFSNHRSNSFSFDRL